MKKTFSFFVLVLLIAFSCKKTDTPTDSGSSQLWVKVSDSVPDFKITLQCLDIKNRENDYFVAYIDREFNPNLRTITVTENGIINSWVLVYKAFDRTDEITLKLSDGKIYKAKGFEFKEKRLVEILHNASGTINVIDRDISMIEKFIYVE